MTSVNNSQISTKDNLITSSATGLLGGALFAVCGYNSNPYIKDGRISDEFTRNVENQLAVKKVGKNGVSQNLNKLNNFIKQIDKAESCSQMAEINFEYFRNLSPDKSFEGIKDFIRQTLIIDMRATDFKKQNLTDVKLDCFLDIIKANNITDLKNGVSNYYKNLMQYFDNFAQMRDSIKLVLKESKNLLLGLKPGESIKDMAETLFDMKTQKFMPDPSGNISNDFFKTLKKTAQNMQWKTAGIWGSAAASIIGGTMFLIQKFSQPRRSKVQTLYKAQRSNQTQVISQPQVQVQPEIRYQPQPLITIQPKPEQNEKPQSLLNLEQTSKISGQAKPLSGFSNFMNVQNSQKA